MCVTEKNRVKRTGTLLKLGREFLFLWLHLNVHKSFAPPDTSIWEEGKRQCFVRTCTLLSYSAYSATIPFKGTSWVFLVPGRLFRYGNAKYNFSFFRVSYHCLSHANLPSGRTSTPGRTPVPTAPLAAGRWCPPCSPERKAWHRQGTFCWKPPLRQQPPVSLRSASTEGGEALPVTPVPGASPRPEGRPSAPPAKSQARRAFPPRSLPSPPNPLTGPLSPSQIPPLTLTGLSPSPGPPPHAAGPPSPWRHWRTPRRTYQGARVAGGGKRVLFLSRPPPPLRGERGSARAGRGAAGRSHFPPQNGTVPS